LSLFTSVGRGNVVGEKFLMYGVAFSRGVAFNRGDGWYILD
jgi:hypothetical protein